RWIGSHQPFWCPHGFREYVELSDGSGSSRVFARLSPDDCSRAGSGTGFPDQRQPRLGNTTYKRKPVMKRAFENGNRPACAEIVEQSCGGMPRAAGPGRESETPDLAAAPSGPDDFHPIRFG